jgi:hypothetical protein
MKKSKQYQQLVLEHLDKVQHVQKPVVVFGAGRGGWYIMKVLEHYGTTITAIADNDIEKQGRYFNYPVFSPEDISNHFSNAYIFLGILNKKNIRPVKKQLQTLGFREIIDSMEAFLYTYFTYVARRECDKEIFAESLFLLYHDQSASKAFFSPTLSYMITQKCSLRCKDCGAFVPAYKSPKSIPIETIINDIRNYCQAFDVVHHIALQGGEPFLYPDIQRLCREVAAIPNLIFVDFVTNGTIVPSGDTIKHFFECGNCILISDYGTVSRKVDELSNALNNHSVYFDYYRYDSDGWGKQTPIFPRNRGLDENTKIYKECIKGIYICCQIMDGELHRCSFSNNSSHLGLLPKFENDYVCLNDANYSEEKLKVQIRALINRNTALNACDFCPANEREYVPAGVQLPNHS